MESALLKSKKRIITGGFFLMKRWMACQQVFFGKKSRTTRRQRHAHLGNARYKQRRKKEKRERWIDREKEKKWSLHIRNSLRMR